MPLDTTALDLDLATITADLPVTVKVGGVSYSASASDENMGRSLEAVGYADDFDVEFTMRVSVMAMPSRGTKLTYNGRTYRVTQNVPSQDGISYRMQCKEQSQR